MSKVKSRGKGARHLEHSFAYSLLHALQHHKQAFFRSLKTLASHPLGTSLTVVALGIILTLPLGGYVIANHFHQVYASLDKGTELTVFLEVGVSEKEALKLKTQFEAIEEVEQIRYKSAEQSLQEFKKSTDLNDIIQLLPENPLPAQLLVKPKDLYSSTSNLKELKEAIASTPQVDEVILDMDWVEKLDAIYRVVVKAVWLLCTLIGLGVIVILTNTIRLSLEKHRDEIVILSLIGATPSYIRRPFIYRAFLYGFLGALLASTLVILALKALAQPISELAVLYSDVLRLDAVPFYAIIALIFSCFILSWLSARLAIMQYSESAHLP